MVNFIGESVRKLVFKVPLSNNVISRRIQDITEKAKDQLIEKNLSNQIELDKG